MKKFSCLFLMLWSLLPLFPAEKTLLENSDFSTWKILPESERSSLWKNLSQFPENWVPLNHPDRIDTVSKGENGGIVLNGMIASKRFYVAPGSELEVKVDAESANGALKVYLFQYLGPSDRYFMQCAYAMDLEGPEIKGKYSTQLKMAAQGQGYIAVVLDGKAVTVREIRLRTLPKTQANNEPAVLPIPERKAVSGKWDILGAREWENALTLRNPFRSISLKNMIFNGEEVSLCADKENCYVLLRTPEKNLTAARIRQRDGEVFLDDSLELIVAPDEKSSKLFHIVVNFDGVVFDEEKSVGQSFRDWNCKGLEVRTGNSGGYALIGLKIPFASVEIADPASPWRFNLCRNMPAGSDKNASLGGGGYFDRSAMPAGTCTKEIDSLQSGVSLEKEKLAFRIAVTGKSGKYDWNVEETRKKTCHESKVLAPNQSVGTFVLNEAENVPGTFEQILKAENGKILFRNTSFITKTDRSPMSGKMETAKHAAFRYYPLQKKIAVILQNIPFSSQKKIGRILCTLRTRGAREEKRSLPTPVFSGNTGWSSAAFEISADGETQYELEIFNTDGSLFEKCEGTFTAKRTYSWLGNSYGKERIVIPPFTDLKVKGNMVSCLLRDYEFDTTGLPRQVTARGQKILSEPVTLNMLDKEGVLHAFHSEALRFTSEEKDRVEFRSEMVCGTSRASLSAWMEYDGVVFYTIVLNSEKPLEIQRLFLSIPYENATHFHVNGAPLRSHRNFYRTVDLSGNGTVWKSTQLPQTPNGYGNFIPSLWLGSLSEGLSFFAESDKGWINSRTSPSYELKRESGKLRLQVNFVAKSAILNGTRTLEFGLIANPFKNRLTGADQTIRWQTTFSRQFFNIGLLPIDDFITSLMIDPKAKSSYLPYTCGNEYVCGDPEFAEVAVEFDRELKPAFDDWELPLFQRKTGGIRKDDYISRQVLWNRYRVDFMIARLHHLMKNFPVDGIYLDNSYVSRSSNPITIDQGFFREDGHLQSRYNLLSQREYLKRIAVMGHLYGKRFPRLVIHNTGEMIPASFAFADVFMDGEMDIHTSHYDVFYPAWNEVMLAADWGLVTGRLTMLNGKVDPARNAAMFSIFKLYDMAFWVTHSGFDFETYRKLAEIEKDFGTNASDSSFSGFWKNNGIVFHDKNSPLQASCFERPGRKLIYMTNPARESATAIFSLPGTGMLTDKLSGEVFRPENGLFRLKIPARNFRCLLYNFPEK